jgi:hypothetical protein
MRCKICNEPYPTSYMVKNHIWRESEFEATDIVCLKCLEHRLKRKLVEKDFIRAKINELLFLGIKMERKAWKIKLAQKD